MSPENGCSSGPASLLRAAQHQFGHGIVIADVLRHFYVELRITFSGTGKFTGNIDSHVFAGGEKIRHRDHLGRAQFDTAIDALSNVGLGAFEKSGNHGGVFVTA